MDNRISTERYFSSSELKKEIEYLFDKGLKYRGHRLMINEEYDAIPSIHTNNRWMLINRKNTPVLQSNICLHRQSKLIEEKINKKFISCRVHSWTYDNDGKLKKAPHFNKDVNGCLSTKPLIEWNGLLFEEKKPTLNLKSIGIDDFINFDEFFFHSQETTKYNFNWKTFSEIYLENYHVYSMHPGLSRFVKPTDLEWHFGEDYSVQKVGLGSNLNSFGSDVYKKWQKEVKEEYGDKLPRYGAIWIYLYPNIMIEWYPNVLVISTVYPDKPNSCINHVEFYYKKSLYEKNPNYYRSIESVYLETAKEDEEACILLNEGRMALYTNNESESGPIDSFLELGIEHFYGYINKNIKGCE